VDIHDWFYCQNKLNREKCDALFMTCCWPLVRISAARRRCSRGCAWRMVSYSQRAGGVKVEHVALN